MIFISVIHLSGLHCNQNQYWFKRSYFQVAGRFEHMTHHLWLKGHNLTHTHPLSFEVTHCMEKQRWSGLYNDAHKTKAFDKVFTIYFKKSKGVIWNEKSSSSIQAFCQFCVVILHLLLNYYKKKHFLLNCMKRVF